MDQISPASSAWPVILLAVGVSLGAVVYIRLARLLALGGGKVSAQEFGSPDVLVCTALIVWAGLQIMVGFGAQQQPITRKVILESAVLYLGMVGLLGLFMQSRGINPLRQFGVLRRNPFVCAGMALGFIAAAFPLVALTSLLTQTVLGGKARQQNIVEYFLNASQGSDQGAVRLTILMAVVVAPIVEETIFRGYIYGVLKRHAGVLFAAVASAGLFAALHLTPSAAPALFVLALCLTLAYEATGSLLVNIFMHSLFNLSMLLGIIWLSHHSAAP